MQIIICLSISAVLLFCCFKMGFGSMLSPWVIGYKWQIFFNRRTIVHTVLWDASFIEPVKNPSNRSLSSFCLLKGHEMNARLSSDSFLRVSNRVPAHLRRQSHALFSNTHFKSISADCWVAERFTSKQSLCSDCPNNPTFPPSCFPLGKATILHKNKPLGGILTIISRSDKFSEVKNCYRSVFFSASLCLLLLLLAMLMVLK